MLREVAAIDLVGAFEIFDSDREVCSLEACERCSLREREGALRLCCAPRGFIRSIKSLPSRYHYLDGSGMSAIPGGANTKSFGPFPVLAVRATRSPGCPCPPASGPTSAVQTVYLSRPELVRLLWLERTPLYDPMTIRTFLPSSMERERAFMKPSIFAYRRSTSKTSSLVCGGRMEAKEDASDQPGAYAHTSICTFSRARHKEEEQISFCYSGRQTMRPHTLRYNFVRICARARIRQEHG